MSGQQQQEEDKEDKELQKGRFLRERERKDIAAKEWKKGDRQDPRSKASVKVESHQPCVHFPLQSDSYWLGFQAVVKEVGKLKGEPG